MRRATEFLRRHPGVLVVGSVAALALSLMLSRAGGDADDGASDAAATAPSEATSDGDPDGDARDGGAAEGGDRGGTGEGGAGGVAPDDAATAASGGGDRPGPTSTTVPLDVDRPRPPVDLDRPPDRGDAVEVARWWAATYTSHVGAEPGTELAERLRDLTADDLARSLARMPPAASYGPPVQVVGVTATAPPRSGDGSGGDRRLQVVVETPGALVAYRMALEDGAGGWRVSVADRL